MSSPVESVRDDDLLKMAEQKMLALGVSALPVVSDPGAVAGVISRTDLLRAGRVHLQNGYRRRVLSLPDSRVREFMTREVQTIERTAPLHEAARRMNRSHIHHLYVAPTGTLEGVLSTHDLVQAVADSRSTLPISAIMSSGVVVVRASDPLSLAIDRLAASHRHGLVVVDQDWPVGMFTQADALAAQNARPAENVDCWMDSGILCLPVQVPAFRAAEQALATRARTVLATDGGGVRGIVTGLDFASLTYAEA